jgi:hypothetical protein
VQKKRPPCLEEQPLEKSELTCARENEKSYHFRVLKRPSQKSLPSSLFQREESVLGIRWKIPLFPPLEKGDEGGFYGFSKD